MRLLKSDYWTARQLARRLRCSRIHAYRKLKSLSAAGVVLVVKTVREKSTGPLATAYRIQRG